MCLWSIGIQEGGLLGESSSWFAKEVSLERAHVHGDFPARMNWHFEGIAAVILMTKLPIGIFAIYRKIEQAEQRDESWVELA